MKTISFDQKFEKHLQFYSAIALDIPRSKCLKCLGRKWFQMTKAIKISTNSNQRPEKFLYLILVLIITVGKQLTMIAIVRTIFL